MRSNRLSYLPRKVYHHLPKILNGVFNFFFGSKIKRRTKLMIESRIKICEVCPHYDYEGKTQNVVIKGKPACDICGCNINLLTACTECECSLSDIGEEPKWQSN